MDPKTIRKKVLLQRMKGNLEKIYKDGDVSELTDESQYLLESIETFEDLYAFLRYEEEINEWCAVDVFGFLLCLVEPDVGFDPTAPLSNRYLTAVNHVEDGRDYG